MGDKIINDPRLVPIQGTFLWYLATSFQVQDDTVGRITVPSFFITDLGSVPRIFWNLIPPEGPATDAYVVHDWLYASQICPRQRADEILLSLTKVLGVSWISRYTVYAALRVGGWAAWNSDSKTGPKFFPH